MSDFDLLTEKEQETVERAALILLTHYANFGFNPCCLVFTADTGWYIPLHACACNPPGWTRSEFRHA